MRRFFLKRNVDDSGISGTGRVAEGCMFGRTGPVALIWCTAKAPTSFVWYQDIQDVRAIHGHQGHTEIEWIDTAETSHGSLVTAGVAEE